MADPFPTLRLRLALLAYTILLYLLLPVILTYLWRRGRKDPLYFAHLGERFGWYQTATPGAVWVHAVSLGEMRSATPLVRRLLNEGERVVTTHFTPAGRREAQRAFEKEIAQGRLTATWVPLEYPGSYRRFLRKFAPKYGLVMEIEIWPRMIMACRKHTIPLFMCNAQYPKKSFEKDKGGLRASLLGGFAGGFVKSEGQKTRFAQAGLRNIHITGELRFDQPIPKDHLDAAAKLRGQFLRDRKSFTLTSVVEGEDQIYLDLIKASPDCFFVYVPRAPERFDEVAKMLADAGISFARRSQILDDKLALHGQAPQIDVLLGDSMGEMYFYLALCDRAIVGGGFVTKGAHNIIEPLALKKPVIVGPHIWTIEYPATEAIEAGVCHHVKTPAELHAAVSNPRDVPDAAIQTFYDEHSGGVEKTMAAIKESL